MGVEILSIGVLLVFVNHAQGATEEVITCFDNTANIQCPNGHLIVVESATYSTDLRPICGVRDANKDCTSTDGILFVNDQCSKKSSCEVAVNDANFGSLCKSKNPMAIRYRCEEDSLFKSICSSGSLNNNLGYRYINSPRYPSNYKKNKVCSKTLSLPTDYHVKVTFLDLDLEARTTQGCYDYLMVKDLDAAYHTYTICGTMLAPTELPTLEHTFENNVEFKFKSDSGTNLRGFLLRYEVIDPNAPETTTTQSTTTESTTTTVPTAAEITTIAITTTTTTEITNTPSSSLMPSSAVEGSGSVDGSGDADSTVTENYSSTSESSDIELTTENSLEEEGLFTTRKTITSNTTLSSVFTSASDDSTTVDDVIVSSTTTRSYNFGWQTAPPKTSTTQSTTKATTHIITSTSSAGDSSSFENITTTMSSYNTTSPSSSAFISSLSSMDTTLYDTTTSTRSTAESTTISPPSSTDISSSYNSSAPTPAIQPTMPQSNSTPAIQPTIPQTNSTPEIQPTIPVSNSTPIIQPTIPQSNSTQEIQPTIPVTNSTPAIQPTIPQSNSTPAIQPTVPQSTTSIYSTNPTTTYSSQNRNMSTSTESVHSSFTPGPSTKSDPLSTTYPVDKQSSEITTLPTVLSTEIPTGSFHGSSQISQQTTMPSQRTEISSSGTSTSPTFNSTTSPTVIPNTVTSTSVKVNATVPSAEPLSSTSKSKTPIPTPTVLSSITSHSTDDVLNVTLALQVGEDTQGSNVGLIVGVTILVIVLIVIVIVILIVLVVLRKRKSTVSKIKGENDIWAYPNHAYANTEPEMKDEAYVTVSTHADYDKANRNSNVITNGDADIGETAFSYHSSLENSPIHITANGDTVITNGDATLTNGGVGETAFSYDQSLEDNNVKPNGGIVNGDVTSNGDVNSDSIPYGNLSSFKSEDVEETNGNISGRISPAGGAAIYGLTAPPSRTASSIETDVVTPSTMTLNIEYPKTMETTSEI